MDNETRRIVFVMRPAPMSASRTYLTICAEFLQRPKALICSVDSPAAAIRCAPIVCIECPVRPSRCAPKALIRCTVAGLDNAPPCVPCITYACGGLPCASVLALETGQLGEGHKQASARLYTVWGAVLLRSMRKRG